MSVYVYALESLTNRRIYVGQSNNFAARLRQHNAGYVPTTRIGRPWHLIAVEQFPNRAMARWAEFQLKKSRGKRVQWISAHALSKK